MAKCIVSSCKRTNCQLFCSPDEKSKLKLWKQILKIEEPKFLICEAHFSKKFLKSEKFLTQDAYPSVLLDNEYNADNCHLCFKTIDEVKFHVDQKFQSFLEQFSVEITLESSICGCCYEKITDFNNLLKTFKEKENFLNNDLKNDSDLLAADSLEKQSTISQLDMQPTCTFENIETKMEESLPPNIDNNNNNDEEMISNYDHNKQTLKRKSMDPSENLKFIEPIDLKRRNSEIGMSKHPESFSSKEVKTCYFCSMEFMNADELKLHFQKEHNKSQLKVYNKKPECFHCDGCNNRFTSYYYLRKHKEKCDFRSTLKCQQHYCRYVGETADALKNHTMEVHKEQFICKICKISFETVELRRNHEFQIHQMKERSRKQKLEVINQEEPSKFSLNLLKTDEFKIKCQDCSQMLTPEKISEHIKGHLRNTI